MLLLLIPCLPKRYEMSSKQPGAFQDKLFYFRLRAVRKVCRMEKRRKTLPYGGKRTLTQAVNRAHRARAGDMSSAGWARFETAFAEEVAKLVERHGLAATLRSLLKYEEQIELPCSLSIIGEWEVKLPNSLDGIDGAVEQAVVQSGSNVLLYISGNGSLSEDCKLRLTERVDVVVPAWEASEIIARNRDVIKAEREHLEEEMKAYGY